MGPFSTGGVGHFYSGANRTLHRERKSRLSLSSSKDGISIPKLARLTLRTKGEYRKWADELLRRSVDALKANRKELVADDRTEVRSFRRSVSLVKAAEISKALRHDTLEQGGAMFNRSAARKASRRSPSAES